MIARQKAAKGVSTVAQRSARSEAAKKGWETRRRSRTVAAPPTLRPLSGSGLFMPFLTEEGLIYVNPVGNDRNLVGKYWNAASHFLETGSTKYLDRFDDRRVWDAETGRHFAFVTNTRVILEFHDQLDFGFSFYKSRREVETMARTA